MTLAPMNEAIRRENYAKNNFIQKKLTVAIWEVIEDARIVLLSKKGKIL